MKRVIFMMAALAAIFSVDTVAQIFYKIEGNGLDKPSYLFGTHHMAPVSILDSYDIDQCLDNVDQVVGEIDMTVGPMALAMAMQSHMMAPSDSTLSKVIPAAKLQQLDSLLSKWAPMPGINISMFEIMKPNVVGTTITAGIMANLMPDFDAEQQLDSYFQTQGKEKGKKIIGLETEEFQAAMLFDFKPISVQAQDLLEILDEDPEKIVEIAEKLNNAYLEADLEALMAINEEDEQKSEFDIALVDTRNANWLQLIPGILSEGPAFIAVGALHLPGENGLIKGLQNLGYTVEAMPVPGK